MSTTRTWSTEQQAIFHWFETSQVPVWAAWGGTGLTPTLLNPPAQLVRSRHLLGRARAGTGKTTTIIEGVDRAPERAILLAAFNKSIAKELQSRVKNPRVECKTAHGLGFKFIVRNWTGVKVDEEGVRKLELAKRAALQINDAAPDPIIKLIAELHTKAREIEPEIAISGSGSDVINVATRFNIVPDAEWEEQGWGGLFEVAEAAYQAMLFAKERTTLIDFADMIFLPIVHRWVRPWFDLVVLDEAQDWTRAMLSLVRGCCRRDGRICIVGDDRQAIYAFRGADSSSLDRLKAELKAAELGLKTTYRCGKAIVTLAQTLVPDFNCPATAPEGQITNADVDKMLDSAREGDFILSRTNAPLVRICMALLKRGRRARIKGREIGRGIVSLIRKLDPSAITDLEPKLVDFLAAEQDRASRMPEQAGIERMQFVQDQVDIIRALTEGSATVAELSGRCHELFADDAERASVMCSSVHKAKGLETDRCYLLEGTFKGGRQEEDNIKYVAITRAKSHLVWVKGYEAQPKAVA
jgi:DNA helicase-2/ATP-dependent DNA helicase PcrA